MPRRSFIVTPQSRPHIERAVQRAKDGEEVTIGEPRKARSNDQNAAMWSGPLRDIADQAWLRDPVTRVKRQYDEDTWHEYFKRAYLPEDDDPNLVELVKNPENYHKWKFLPDGERVLNGSTTELTKRGFHEYVTKIEAQGAGLGVQFSASPMMAA